MIPQADVHAWREHAPWVTDAQVEQDLVLSRALVDIFSEKNLRSEFACRGGTALNKLVFTSPMRYSEDIDLVQISPRPIGATLNLIRKQLDPWLGKPKRERSEGGVTLQYRFSSEIPPVVKLRLKIEINTREHFTVFDLISYKFSVGSRWFSGSTEVPTYNLEELLGTKLRALYQRKKGRDLFDIVTCLETFSEINKEAVVRCFQKYMDRTGHRVLRNAYEENINKKILLPSFCNDLTPLLTPDTKPFNFAFALELLKRELLVFLPDVTK